MRRVIRSRRRKDSDTTYIGKPGHGLAIGLDWKHLAFFFHNNHGGSNPRQIYVVTCIFNESLLRAIHRRICSPSRVMRLRPRRGGTESGHAVPDPLEGLLVVLAGARCVADDSRVEPAGTGE